MCGSAENCLENGEIFLWDSADVLSRCYSFNVCFWTVHKPLWLITSDGTFGMSPFVKGMLLHHEKETEHRLLVKCVVEVTRERLACLRRLLNVARWAVERD